MVECVYRGPLCSLLGPAAPHPRTICRIGFRTSLEANASPDKDKHHERRVKDWDSSVLQLVECYNRRILYELVFIEAYFEKGWGESSTQELEETKAQLITTVCPVPVQKGTMVIELVLRITPLFGVYFTENRRLEYRRCLAFLYQETRRVIWPYVTG